MDKRRTIFPGTAGDPSWRTPEPLPKSTSKRSIESPVEVETKVLKKQATLSIPLESRLEPVHPLTKTKEHGSVITKQSPVAKNRILLPTFVRLASLLPIFPESPWSKYRAILREEQGGDAIIAHSIEASFELVVVRSSRNTPSQRHGGNLKNASHANIVPLYHAFQHKESLYFVYSPMSVPLAALQCVAEKGFEEFEVAAICKEILSGLNYIHTTLEISYGILGSENILLDSRANVKLANIGESMLNQAKEKRKDISDLSILAAKLTGNLDDNHDRVDGGTIGLGSGISDFMMSTRSMDVAELQVGYYYSVQRHSLI